MSNETQTQVFTLTFGGKKKRKVDGKELPPFTAKTVTIDFLALPESSRNKIVEYGLTQYIGDGAAGAGDQTDFDSGIDKRVSNLTSGDFTRETRGGGLDPYASVDRLTATKCRAVIAAKLKANNLVLPKEKRDELLAAFLADPAKSGPYRAEAEREIEAMKSLAAKETDTEVTPETVTLDSLGF